MNTLPRMVFLLAWVSFFNDVASDMVIPLLPLLLAGPTGGGALALGLIEGCADAVASLMRLWSGRRSDRSHGGRKPLAVAGYALSNTVRPLLALAPSWGGVLVLRALDRVGKGVRSAPRDALLADLVTPDMRGRAFGVHRAFDNAGAVFGALLAAWALARPGANLQSVVLWSAVPGTLAVFLLVVGVRSQARTGASVSDLSLPADPAALPRTLPQISSMPSPADALLRTGQAVFLLQSPANLRPYLRALLCYTLSRASETFIVLRGSELGLSPTHLLILWAGLNAVKSLTAHVGGGWADRYGRLTVMRLSWIGAIGTSVALAAAPDGRWLVAAALLGSLPVGLGEGAERAYIADLALPEQRGAAFGWYNLTTGIAALPAGVLFGGLWQTAGAPSAFLAAAACGVLALLLLPKAQTRVAPVSP